VGSVKIECDRTSKAKDHSIYLSSAYNAEDLMTLIVRVFDPKSVGAFRVDPFHYPRQTCRSEKMFFLISSKAKIGGSAINVVPSTTCH